MAKENSSNNNKVTIIVAIITSVTSISVAVVTGFFGLRAVQMQKEAESTSSAIQVIATQGGETQAVLANTVNAPSSTPYPTFTTEPTYTPLATYTPFPLPKVNTPTPTPEKVLLFADNFDTGISDYWQRIGDWMISDGKPVLNTGYKTENYLSPFYWGEYGGLLLPGSAGFDNYAVEFDFPGEYVPNTGDPFYAFGLRGIIFSYVDDNNYAAWFIEWSGYGNSASLVVVSAGEKKTIPESNLKIENFSTSNNIRIEIKGKSFAMYLNDKNLYNFVELSTPMTGITGIIGSKSPVLDNYRIYQLP